MKSFHLKIHILLFLLFQTTFSFSQNIRNLDSLENQLKEFRITNPDEAIKIGGYILEHTTSNSQRSNTLALMSFAYFAKNDTQKSTEFLFRAKNEAEKTNDPKVTSQIYGTIAQMYHNLQFNYKAINYLNKSIDEAQKLPVGNDKFRIKGLLFIELGKIKLNDEKWNEATICFRGSLSEFDKMTDNRLYFLKRSYYNIGESFYSMKKPDSAQFYLEKTLTIKENKAVNPYALFTLSKLFRDKKQFKRAIDTLSAVLEHKTLNDNLLKSEIYLSISKNYNTLGDFKKYKLYNEKYLALKQQSLNTNLSTIKNALNIEEKNLTNKITSARNNIKILIIIIFFSSCLAIVVFIQIRKKRKNQKIQYEAVISNLRKKTEQINFPKITQAKQDDTNLSMPAEIEQNILERLIKFEQSDKFTNPKLNISTLSIQFKTNTTYLSKIINKYKGKNFNAYINELRINYICEKIHHNQEYSNYKISYLGEVSGFSNHSTFTTVFKSITGISPSTFIKQTEATKKLKKQP